MAILQSGKGSVHRQEHENSVGTVEQTKSTYPPFVDLGMFNARNTKGDQSTERTSDDTGTDEERDSLGDFSLQVPDGEEEGHGLTEHCFTDTDEETADVESRKERE
jgi:hypothetical protein